MSQFDKNLSVDFKGLTYKTNTDSAETKRKFEESQVQFIPVQIHNEDQRHKHPSLRSEHCYSRAELRAITKFNSLFKKIVVLPSKNRFSEIELSTHKSIPEENAPRHKAISALKRTCYDLGHNSKEIQTFEIRGDDYYPSEELNQFARIEECPKEYYSRAKESKSEKIFEENEFEECVPQNLWFLDEKNIELYQDKSMRNISWRKKSYRKAIENRRSTKSQKEDDINNYTYGFDKNRAMKRRCISEKIVKFRKSDDVSKNKTNSLNLHKNCSACTDQKNYIFRTLNTNIYNYFGSNGIPKRKISITKPQFSSSLRSYTEDYLKRNKMSTHTSSFTRFDEYITNSYSKVKRLIFPDDFSYKINQGCLNTSSFLLQMLGDEYPIVYNFNTRIIEILSEKKKYKKSRLSEIDIQSILKNHENEALINIQGRFRVGEKYGNIVPSISLYPLVIEDELLLKGVFSMNISRSLTLEKGSLSTFLDILIKSEQKMLMSTDNIELSPNIFQGFQFNEKKLAIIQNIISSVEHVKNEQKLLISTDSIDLIPIISQGLRFNEDHSISSIEDGKIGEETSHILIHNSIKHKEEISKTKNMKSKINRDRRREFFQQYEKRRARKLRKMRKFKNDLNLSAIEIKQENASKDHMISSEERISSIHKKSSLCFSGGYTRSPTLEPDIFREIPPKNNETQDNIGLSREPLLIKNEDSMNAIPFSGIFMENYYGKNISKDKNSNNIETNPKTYHPYGKETYLYPVSVDFNEQENDVPSTSKEIKHKLTFKEATRKIIKWIKSLGLNFKHENRIKNKINETSWEPEVNLMKQRNVLRSKLRYPKIKTSKLYLHRRDYQEAQLRKTEASKLKTIDPVLKEILSAEIIEPEYEDEEDSTEGKKEEEVPKPEEEEQLLSSSEESMVLSDRKKVYDRLQKYGKLFYTIYLNEKDDWDHVSIRSAESVERIVECEDTPFFATYDLGPNDLRVHVTKDVFVERKKESIFKDENYVECKNSKVKLTLMRGKRYNTDSDPKKANIIEIDCTNQFSEIKICYKKTEPSRECVCKYPQVCKTVQLESSELSSLDINREDKFQDTQDLDELQNTLALAKSEDAQELFCEYCRNCHENPETCDNYEECLEQKICGRKKEVAINSSR